MPFVLYNVQGEEGDDPAHPNYFRATLPASPVLRDFVDQFPLARHATFHYRFKKKAADPTGSGSTSSSYVWKDLTSPSARVPTYNGLIWAKVMQTSTTPTEITAPAAPTRAAAAPKTTRKSVSAASSSRPPKAAAAGASGAPRRDRATPQPVVADQSASLFGSNPTSPGSTAAGASTGGRTHGRAPSHGSDAGGSRPGATAAAAAGKRPNTDGIGMADIKLGAGFESKSEAVQQAMIQRAKELVAKQREKVKKLQDKDLATANLKAAKRAAEGATGAELDGWASDGNGGMRKLRTLLCELPKVLWEGTKWKSVDMGDVMAPNKVRLVYFKAMRIVHPDKLKADASPEQKVRAERIFDALNKSWKQFQAHEM